MEFFGIDMVEAIKTIGYVGLFAIVFAETGLFLGFFFPGDSLLFVAGVLAAQGFFSLPILLIVLFVAAFTGNMVGYWFGAFVGPKIFSREDSLFFRKSHVFKAQAFYDRYGAKTIVLARFIPIVRTFAPIVAGVAKMHYGTFTLFNFIGALLWSVGLTTLAYYLGGLIEDIDRYLLPIVLFIIGVSVLPGVFEYWRSRKS
ncbi:MAG: VTT domain-containing protein [Candidatus Moranbacteria bacterium]|nr:VTT domain-containing protein [Candidatus Moranbacteria bacterium]